MVIGIIVGFFDRAKLYHERVARNGYRYINPEYESTRMAKE
jgi:hypothetical protein